MITVDAFISLVCTIITLNGDIKYQSCEKELMKKCKPGGMVITCSNHIQDYVKSYREGKKK